MISVFPFDLRRSFHVVRCCCYRCSAHRFYVVVVPVVASPLHTFTSPRLPRLGLTHHLPASLHVTAFVTVYFDLPFFTLVCTLRWFCHLLRCVPHVLHSATLPLHMVHVLLHCTLPHTCYTLVHLCLRLVPRLCHTPARVCILLGSRAAATRFRCAQFCAPGSVGSHVPHIRIVVSRLGC